MEESAGRAPECLRDLAMAIDRRRSPADVVHTIRFIPPVKCPGGVLPSTSRTTALTTCTRALAATGSRSYRTVRRMSPSRWRRGTSRCAPTCSRSGTGGCCFGPSSIATPRLPECDVASVGVPDSGTESSHGTPSKEAALPLPHLLAAASQCASLDARIDVDSGRRCAYNSHDRR